MVKIVESIINIIQWLSTNGARIISLVNSVLSSVEAIVSGNIGGAVALVEQSLANMLPVAIGFLADLAGLGGITDKVKEIIGGVRADIDKAIDKIINWVIEKFTTTLCIFPIFSGRFHGFPALLLVPNVGAKQLAPGCYFCSVRLPKSLVPAEFDMDPPFARSGVLDPTPTLILPISASAVC